MVWGRTLPFWTRVTLVWLMAITVSGAAVRLTGSGLGCLDWPTCTSNQELDAPGFHATIEFGNRVISGLAIIPVIAGWVAARRLDRRDLDRWFGAMVVGFGGQVLLGMLVTRSHLDPRVVIGHFLLSIVLIFVGVALDHGARTQPRPATTDDTWFARVAVAATALAGLVIVLGTLVTGSGPHTGSDVSGDAIPRLGFDIREITRIHSVTVWVLGAVLFAAVIRARQTESPHEQLITWVIGLGTLQGAIGYLQYFTGVPVLLVGFHIAGSVVFWTTLVWWLFDTRSGRVAPLAESAPRATVTA